MTTMFVKPAPGLKIADPVRRDFIEQEGREVPCDMYWNRRLAARDVVLAAQVIEAEIVEKADAKATYETRMMTANLSAVLPKKVKKSTEEIAE